MKKRYENSKKTNVSAKKSLGQHFLRDEKVLGDITAMADIKKSSTVLEIGGGMGDFSSKLAPLCKKLVVIEKDKDMLPFLRLALSNYEAEIILGDVLETDLEELLKNEASIQIAANLPYYLTTEIMERVFMLKLPVKTVSVMVQKEAGEKLNCREGSKKWGPLGLLASICATCKGRIDVPAEFFTPPPKVDSVFLHFEINKLPPDFKAKIPKLYSFFKLCFSKRRKTLLNNLSALADKETIENALYSSGLNKNIRAEEVPADKFLEIAEKLNITNL